MKYTQFVMVTEDGDQACRTHQDDSETPLTAYSLEQLLSDIADYDDTSISQILKRLDPTTGKLTLEAGEFTLKRLEVEEKDLEPADAAYLAGMVAKRDTDEDDD